MSDVMCGAVLTGHGGLEKLEWREDFPRPVPNAGEVLIRVGASAVNNTDVNTRLAWYSKGDGAADDASWSGQSLTFPHIQGIDCVGEVIECGDGADTSLIGRRVMVEPCLRETGGKALDTPWFLGSECPGGFAEYVCVAARHAFPIESALSDVELATFPCSYSTAENMITRAGARSGERAIVTGASGGVGSAAIQLLRARGVEVVAITSPSKSAALIELGAEETIDRDEDPVTRFGESTFDLAIDLVGGATTPRLLDALRPGGRYAVAGAVGDSHSTFDLRTVYLKDLSLFGCTALDDGVFAGLIGHIERGDIRPLLAETFDLKDIRAAQTTFLERRHIGKIGLQVQRTL